MHKYIYPFAAPSPIMKIAGIDEAGKGPVIGPMCVAGALIEEEKMHLIDGLGLKDSKKLTPKRREFFDGEIKKIVDGWFVLEVSARQIDELRTVMTMNEIMVKAFARVLENLEPEHAFLDALCMPAAAIASARLTCS